MVLVNDPEAREQFSELALDHLLRAARLKMILVDDREALAKMDLKHEPRNAMAVRLNNNSRRSARRRKNKPKSTRVKKSPRPTRGKPYLSDMSEAAS